jgi:hypothetical protein
MKKKIFYLGISGVLFFVSSSIIGAIQLPGYSHLTQYISESYASGTTYGVALRFFGYLPSGILLTAFSLLALKVVPSSKFSTIGFLGLSVFYGLVTIIVAFFPCDTGCNRAWINPSMAQIIHNVAGFTTYIFVPAALIMIGVAAKDWKNAVLISRSAIFAGVLSMLTIVLLLSDPNAKYVGLFQRIIELSILSWIVLCSVYIKNVTYDKS